MANSCGRRILGRRCVTGIDGRLGRSGRLEVVLEAQGRQLHEAVRDLGRQERGRDDEVGLSAPVSRSQVFRT